MPLYEYQCQDCGSRTEELQRLADPPLTVCPRCGGVYRKLVSAPAFQFKGSGWYVTDYAKKGGGEAGSKESGGSDGAKTEAQSGSKQEGAGSPSAGEAKAPASSPSGEP